MARLQTFYKTFNVGNFVINGKFYPSSNNGLTVDFNMDLAIDKGCLSKLNRREFARYVALRCKGVLT